MGLDSSGALAVGLVDDGDEMGVDAMLLKRSKKLRKGAVDSDVSTSTDRCDWRCASIAASGGTVTCLGCCQYMQRMSLSRCR